MPLRILLPLLLVQEVLMDPFQPMSGSCIYWDSLDIYANGHTEKLHCIPDEKNELGIVNATWKRIQPGYCPYFDRYSKQINAKPCNAELGKCPEKSVLSYQAVKYSACYNIRQRNEINKTNTDEQERTTLYTQNTYHTENCKSWPILVTLLSAAAIVTVLLGLYIYEQNQQKRKKPKRESISEDGNSQYRVDEKPEQNGDVQLLGSQYQTKDDKDEFMNLRLRLVVKTLFENEAFGPGGLATVIPEEEREYMREKLQKLLNALSTNTC